MPNEGSAFHPPYVIRNGGGLGAPEGEQDRAHGPSWHHPADLLKAVLSPGPQGRAVPGGLVGMEGTELSKAEERAEPNAVSCHSGCSSSSFVFY